MAITRTPRKRTGTGTANTNTGNAGYNFGVGSAVYGAWPVVAASKPAATSSGGGSSYSSGGSSGGSSYSRSSGRSSGSSGGGSRAASSSSWGCPSGASLVTEPGGTGNLVCRWNHNGALFPAQPKGGGSSAPAPATPVSETPVAEQTASQWLQGAADTFASDPQAMLAITLKDKYGESGGNALYGMLEPYADAINSLFLSQRGTSLESGSKDQQLQYMEDYWNQLQTPGARIDTRLALDNIFAAPDGSPLQQYLTTGDAKQQAGNTLNLIAGALQTGYTPTFANAVMERLRLERDRYLGESGRSTVGSFIDYINENVPGIKNLMG